MLKQAQFKLLSGDEAIAYSVKQCDVDLIAAYPITPQTIIVERLSESIEINYDYCKGCGICAEECPRIWDAAVKEL